MLIQGQVQSLLDYDPSRSDRRTVSRDRETRPPGTCAETA